MGLAASVTDKPEVQSEDDKLKHLDFVEDAMQEAVGIASSVYDYVKDKVGAIPGVETIETTVKSVVGPAIDKFQDANVEALKFVDRKIDEVLPSAVKDITATAKSLSTEVVSDVKNNGLVETTKDLLVKIEPAAEEYASSAWETLSKIPLLTNVAKAFAPAATLVADKYNETVQQTAEEGYKVSSFLPLVPTEKIAKVFTIPKAEPADVAGGEEAAEVPGVEGEIVEEE
uniref:Small rubber particle protein n=1 Tax=Lactuca sativa TaxID=4236 RepID=A0A0B4UDC1_LACSA|nr:small rubber particle protein [Lactuca sativa]